MQSAYLFKFIINIQVLTYCFLAAINPSKAIGSLPLLINVGDERIYKAITQSSMFDFRISGP